MYIYKLVGKGCCCSRCFMAAPRTLWSAFPSAPPGNQLAALTCVSCKAGFQVFPRRLAKQNIVHRIYSPLLSLFRGDTLRRCRNVPFPGECSCRYEAKHDKAAVSLLVRSLKITRFRFVFVYPNKSPRSLQLPE